MNKMADVAMSAASAIQKNMADMVADGTVEIQAVVENEVVEAKEREVASKVESSEQQEGADRENAGQVAAHSAALMTEAANFLNAGAAALGTVGSGKMQYVQSQQQYTTTKYSTGAQGVVTTRTSGTVGTPAGSAMAGIGAAEAGHTMIAGGVVATDGVVTSGGLTNVQSRTTYTTGTPTVSGSVMTRTYESTGATPISGHTRVISGYGKTMSGVSGITSGGASYQTTRNITSTGVPMMTGANYSQRQTTTSGGAYATGYSTTTSDNIVSQSRGVEQFAGERLISSNIVSEAFMGAMPMEDDVQYVEVPIIEEVVKTVPRKEVVEVEKFVPKYEYQWVEKIVEIPQVHYIDRQVEVPEYVETVRHVPKVEIIEVPREVVRTVPKYETKIIEQTVEVPGEVIEVPKPYTVENKIVVPRYKNAEVPVVVAQSLVPRISESAEDFVDVELSEYVPKLVTVDVYVPKPVQRPLLAKARYDEHRVVDIPVAHFNGLLKHLNVSISDEELRAMLIKEESGAIAMAPVVGPLVAPVSTEWESGHIAGQLHYTTSSTNTNFIGGMPSVGTLGSTIGSVTGGAVISTHQKGASTTTATTSRQMGGSINIGGAAVSGGFISGATQKNMSSITTRSAGQTIGTGMQLSGMQHSSNMQSSGMQVSSRGMGIGAGMNLGSAGQRQWGAGAQFSAQYGSTKITTSNSGSGGYIASTPKLMNTVITREA